MNVVETYLKNLGEVYSTGGGVAEKSYYAALENLLNDIGRKLKPRVRCVHELKNIGAGEPDFGLYTANQFQRSKDARPMEGQLPERGVIECKGWSDDSFVRTKNAQVTKYWRRYGIVIVTNYRDFVLIGCNGNGKPVRLESYSMAKSEKQFMAMLAHPKKVAQEQSERLVEFLKRAMLHAAPISKPEDLAWFLASYARDARCRVEQKKELPALEGLKNALEEALGMKFEAEKGQHFFLATLVQTLFYGVFSSWVLWSRENWRKSDAKFNWHDAAWTMHVPMIASLFDQIATPQRLKPLGIDEVLDWAGMVLNRVDRPTFFSRFEEEHAVQYFYEPFLKAYDPELRKELGVWYTPPEIVQYQVERVDQVLREELYIADGLADEQVVILDPCCGTGAYLVETLKRIHKTLEQKGQSALTAQKLKKAAKERVFGFEILPAPFVVSHLQIGLMLRHLGAPLNPDSNERAGVYLTNALTGWEPLEDPKTLLPFPELKEERDAANRVKQETPILVILGNPPYNAFAGTSPDEEGGLVEPYKGAYTVDVTTKSGRRKQITKYRLSDPINEGGWGIKKYNLDDPYIRFFRIAERRIVKSGKGIVTYISNYSWTQEASFVIVRERLLQSFDKFWIENMHGNRKISEYAPDGRTSETVFSIPGFSPGIRQGIVISLWLRCEANERKPGKVGKVLYRDDLDAAKASERRQQLLSSLTLKNFDRKYEKVEPSKVNRYSFRPSSVEGEYMEWPSVIELCHQIPSNGLMEKRGGALIEIDRKTLAERMKDYYDAKIEWNTLHSRIDGLAKNAARYNAQVCRRKVLKAETYDESRLYQYALRPFDNRWCYYSPVRPLWNEPRPSYYEQCWDGNSFLMTRPGGVANPEGVPLFHSTILGDNDFQRGHAYYFPIRLREESQNSATDGAMEKMYGQQKREVLVRANLSKVASDYLSELGIVDPDKDAETSELIWMHALAIGYSPIYLKENTDGIRQGWPRIPLPGTKKALLKSAELGRRVAALLDTEKGVQGVTCGKIDTLLKDIAVVSKVGGGTLNPDEGHLDVTAGWGHAGKGGVCMPGKGKYELREQRSESLKRAFGTETMDVYLNDEAYWSNVPKCIWDYYIGGYQVIKKWLSYREKGMLGSGLKIEEAEYVTEMARRLAALILMQGELDANYEAVKGDTWAWPREMKD
ncbi:MAG: DNA methyltransferase [Planctomycetes bacterium RBG_16_55_9]|nr:MAG: DNA methyltransferase [Planctomycetes bacterium RBG_16_55_9]